MKGVYFTIILFLSYSVHLWGQASHLLLSSQGDGAQVSLKNGAKEVLKRASYLPKNQLISMDFQCGATVDPSINPGRGSIVPLWDLLGRAGGGPR